jgi:hypothetical protein
MKMLLHENLFIVFLGGSIIDDVKNSKFSNVTSSEVLLYARTPSNSF